MNEQEARELAEEHWTFLEKWLHMMFIDAWLHSWKHTKQDGIKEVVEWIEQEDAIDRMMRERWQAKLNEWGIEKEK